MTPPPGSGHNNAVSRLIRLLSEYLIKSDDKGTLFVPRAAIWTSAHTYLEPDLFYVSAETKEEFDPKHFTTADLVVEVISPGSAIYDRNTKQIHMRRLVLRSFGWLKRSRWLRCVIRHPAGRALAKYMRRAISYDHGSCQIWSSM